MVFRSLVAYPRHLWPRLNDDSCSTLQRALQRTLDDVWHGVPAAHQTETAAMSVRLDVKEDASAFHVTADLPGLSENEVEVTFNDGVLTIRGDRKLERDETKGTWHILERSHGGFVRQLSLPTDVNAEKIEARFDRGVLKLTLPKVPAEQTAAKKITIKAGS